MAAFDTAFEITVTHEGGFSDNPNDPGNWTGGSVGQGQLKGTKYGISAASFPSIDIAALTLDASKQLYKTNYWDKLELDNCDPALAIIAFDAACNNGVGAAIRWLQAAVGVVADGVIGPQTRAAIAKADPQAALVELHGARINMMAGLSTWPTFGRGWSKRLAQLPYQAALAKAQAT